MTDPTTTPTPPQGLTDAQLLELAEKELCIDDTQDAHEQRYPLMVLTDERLATTTAVDHANLLRDATKMALTPEEVEARFRSWWAESYPLAPAGGHAVRSHVAFALHLLGGEVGQ